jgi:metal-sulfur cluster biosynthetic enzyme
LEGLSVPHEKPDDEFVWQARRVADSLHHLTDPETKNLFFRLGIIEDTVLVDDNPVVRPIDRLADEHLIKLVELGVTQEVEVDGYKSHILTELGQKVMDICFKDTPDSVKQAARLEREKNRRALEKTRNFRRDIKTRWHF